MGGDAKRATGRRAQPRPLVGEGATNRGKRVFLAIQGSRDLEKVRRTNTIPLGRSSRCARKGNPTFEELLGPLAPPTGAQPGNDNGARAAGYFGRQRRWAVFDQWLKGGREDGTRGGEGPVGGRRDSQGEVGERDPLLAAPRGPTTMQLTGRGEAHARAGGAPDGRRTPRLLAQGTRADRHTFFPPNKPHGSRDAARSTRAEARSDEGWREPGVPPSRCPPQEDAAASRQPREIFVGRVTPTARSGSVRGALALYRRDAGGLPSHGLGARGPPCRFPKGERTRGVTRRRTRSVQGPKSRWKS